MPTRLPDRCLPDSIQEFRAAARQRFRDGEVLEAAGRRTAAIYLWGYVAEMTLKASYFDVLGFPETQTITPADLRAAAAAAPGLGVVWPAPTRFHDVRLQNAPPCVVVRPDSAPRWADRPAVHMVHSVLRG
jgi:hypothetical protein